MAEKSLWTKKIESDPAHSAKFIARFRDKAARGEDIVGEARLVDAMAPRGARIFDAGCGSGRIGGELARLGHTVVGVDVDAALIAAAHEDHPAGTWLVGDLADIDLTAGPLADACAGEPFDIAVAAGNVLPFLAPSTRRDVLTRLRSILKPGGRLTLGFGAGRGYPFDEFSSDAAHTGWTITAKFRGWNLLPFETASEFLVAIMAPASPWGQPNGPERSTVREMGALDPMAGNTLPPLA